MKVETTSESILRAVKKNPSMKAALRQLFPEVFENEVIFCAIGSIFFRTDYPNNIYAVVKKGNQVIVMNVTYSAKWNDEGKRNLNISDLADFTKENITIAEFKKLTGFVNLANFVAVPKEFNKNLMNYTITTRDMLNNR